VLGELPQDLKFKGKKTTVEIGNNSILREFVTIHRGTAQRRKTTLGNNAYLMAYSHIAHDCTVGDHVTMANLATLGGHVNVADWVTLSGGAMVHQFVTIGEHAFIGGLFRVTCDVPPFVLAVGEPLKYGGINSVGLRRYGFSSQDRINIKHAYRIFFKSNMNSGDAIKKIQADLPHDKNVSKIVEFIANTNRGIIKS